MTLWEFSLSIYSKTGVADACLTLQNRFGCDVNLLLHALWLADQGCGLSTEQREETLALCTRWRQGVVQALRSIRTDMKTWPENGILKEFSLREDFESLRTQIKLVELEAERHQQLVIESLYTRQDLPADLELDYFLGYLSALISDLQLGPAALADETQRDLARLISQVASGVSVEFGLRVERALSLGT